MTTLEEMVLPHLEEDEIARIDALAQKREVTREQMLATIIRAGLLVHRDDEPPPPSGIRMKGDAS